MKENMLDVLMYLFEHYTEEELAVAPNHETLKLTLIDVGFQSSEVNKAFTWLEGLAQHREDDGLISRTRDSALRVFTKNESIKLDVECRGFILYLEQVNVLTPVMRELVIERAMALDAEEIDLDRLKWVVLMVLFNQPGQEEAYAMIEDIVFDDVKSILH